MISFTSLFEWIFPSKYSQKDLMNIKKAPWCEITNVFSLYDYQSSSGKKLIYYIKKYRDRNLSKLLAEQMYLSIQEYLSEQQQFSFFLEPLIIPVPITKKQQKIRGFNQSENIAQHFAKYTNGYYLNKAVVKKKETQKQALLAKRSQRFINVQNCFAVSKKNSYIFKHQDIIIIDDLVTTGATISSLEKTLRTTGARNVIAITIAH